MSVNENRHLDDKNSPGVATMATPGHYEEMGKDPSSSSPLWEQADAHGVSERHLRQMWEDAGQIKQSAHYQDLLGPPTMRERAVALWRRVKGGISEKYRGKGNGISYRPLWAGAAAMGALAVIGTWVIWPAGPDYETQIAQVQDIALNDGSIVTLGAQSALDVDFTDEARTVRLASGEAFFAISKDRQRPFVVLAGDKHIRVVGTRFNVNYEGGRVHVAVEEGIVDVMQPTMGTISGDDKAHSPIMQKIRLVAGQQLTLPRAGAMGKPQSLAGARPGSWREGRLNYQDALLSDIIADAGRYYSHDIRIASPSLAQERLTTSFRTSQVDAMLSSLPHILPVEAVHLPDGTVELRRKDMPTAR